MLGCGRPVSGRRGCSRAERAPTGGEWVWCLVVGGQSLAEGAVRARSALPQVGSGCGARLWEASLWPKWLFARRARSHRWGVGVMLGCGRPVSGRRGCSRAERAPTGGEWLWCLVVGGQSLAEGAVRARSALPQVGSGRGARLWEARPLAEGLAPTVAVQTYFNRCS